ncbi:hypothetical protein O4J56_03160 [Nocardiopsis sp. RSe5-2]|uniref:Trp biosynthesis protein n=1 Tax=Nocardiopsis endophytica TaxID=3018445 RepID=A0ABT4TZH1_9ACTN|nr:hypothetical protein [Nocardiopsis endophytica]MDA2809630.1 hypothetical protein [Nocardiopsis endophytica]
MDETAKSATPSTVLAAGALLLGAGPAAWWAVRTPPDAIPDADHAIAAPALPDGAAAAVGIAGAALALAGLALLIRLAATGRIGALHLCTALLLAPVPAMAGVWWAVATAPVIGANIGFGLATVVFPPIAAVLLAAALTTGLLARRKRRASRSGTVRAGD